MTCGTRMAPAKSSTAMVVAPPSHRSEIMPLERTSWGVRSEAGGVHGTGYRVQGIRGGGGGWFRKGGRSGWTGGGEDMPGQGTRRS